MPDADDREEALYRLSELRAEIAIDSAFSGFDIDEEEALRLIREIDVDALTDRERDQRDRLIAAVSNLIEFAVCEEYHLYKDVEELGKGNDDEDWLSENEEFLDEYLALHKKYNEKYAGVEDGDIEYAMAMAAMWIKLNKNQTLTYMTQNDERVRPWHYVLQGFTAKRDDFPAWMIPPIEWACRCYLISNDETIAKNNFLSSVKAEVMRTDEIPRKPNELDGIFKESVCKCGRIFSDEHPYFEVEPEDESMLRDFVERLREKYYG